MNGILEALRGSADADERPEASVEGDAMVIPCRGCRLAPVPGSDECIRCMVDLMCDTGGCERIVLRTGRDIEISGEAGRAIRDVASVKRWSYSRERLPASCRGCPVSREEVMDAAWSAFPKEAVSEGRRMLRDGPPDKDGCRECFVRTGAALDQMDEGLRAVLDRMAGGGMR